VEKELRDEDLVLLTELDLDDPEGLFEDE